MVAPVSPVPKFKLGRTVATPGALDALERAGQDAAEFLDRHARGDWGEVGEADWKVNDAAVAHEHDPDRQARLLSAYRTGLGERLWVITEADRSATTLLLPDEY